MDTDLTRFSPAVMVSKSCWNSYSFVDPYCLVPLEYATVEESLVIALDFVRNQNNLTIILVGLR